MPIPSRHGPPYPQAVDIHEHGMRHIDTTCPHLISMRPSTTVTIIGTSHQDDHRAASPTFWFCNDVLSPVARLRAVAWGHPLPFPGLRLVGRLVGHNNYHNA
jgi:hypothetical protein